LKVALLQQTEEASGLGVALFVRRRLVERRVLTKPRAIAKISKTLRARPFGNLLFETSFIESLDQRFSIF
jgi:hypothetical protein